MPGKIISGASLIQLYTGFIYEAGRGQKINEGLRDSEARRLQQT